MPQRLRQADPLHERRGRSTTRSEADEHLAQGASAEAQHRAHQHAPGRDEQRDHAQGFEVREMPLLGFAAHRAEHEQQRDDGKILEQEHGEGSLAAGRLQQVLLAERGEADGGRGHRDSHAGDQPHDERLPERERRRGDRGDRHRDLHGSKAENRAAQRLDALEVELEADEEEQQHHAELRELQNPLRIGDQFESPGPDRHARHEITEHRAQSEAPEDRHGEHSGGEEDEGLLQKAVRFHV